MTDELHIVGGEFLGGGSDVADDWAQVLLAELDLHGAGEVDQGLDDAVKAVNLGVNDFEVADGGCAGVAELGLEQLEVDDDGVDGVLDLVADAGGEAADGGHAAGEFQLRLDLLGGLEVVEGDERAQALRVSSSWMKSSEAWMRRPVSVRISSWTRVMPVVEGVAKGAAEHRGAVEDLA